MFCSVCGKGSAADANFCPGCGAAVAAAQLPGKASSQLVRPRSPRMIAGVCSGLAIHFGWDLSLTRILLCVFTVLTSGLGFLCYVAAWILVPEAPFATPAVNLTYAPASPVQPAPPADYGQRQGQA